MYTLGIPKRDYRRATQVLGYEAQAKDGKSIDFEATLKDDDFYEFSFPDANEDDFKYIANKLKGEGVRIIGADAQLTEKKIMKLVDLITEAPTLAELEDPKWLNILKNTFENWQSKQYKDDQNKWEMFNEDIKILIEQWESELDEEQKDRKEKERMARMQDAPTSPTFVEPNSTEPTSLSEQKLRSLIRKTIRQ